MRPKTAVIVATWFKTGLIRSFLPTEMGGTYGSFFALPLCVGAVLLTRFLQSLGWPFVVALIPYLTVTAVILVLGMRSVPIAEKVLGPHRDHTGTMRDRDQNCIVIDEVLGMLIVCSLFTDGRTGLHWFYFLCAFGLFRVFDIVKVPPTRYFDRKKSAAGVMLDDVVAGIYAAIALLLVLGRL